MTRRLRFNARSAGLVLVLLYAAAVVALLALGVAPDLLRPSFAKGKGLGEFIGKVDSIKGPATLALGSLSGIGLVLGGGLLALGQQSGARIMALAACAFGGVLLGDGLIA